MCDVAVTVCTTYTIIIILCVMWLCTTYAIPVVPFSTKCQVLQLICSYQYFNYTISMANHNGNITQLGPYQQYGSDTVSQTVSLTLEEDSQYTLWITVGLITGTLTSDEHFFGN